MSSSTNNVNEELVLELVEEFVTRHRNGVPPLIMIIAMHGNDRNLDIQPLIQLALQGDRGALADLFERHRARLRKMVDLRLDRRIRGRVNPSDVLQEAYVDLATQIDGYRADPKVPFFIWMRWLTGQRLAKVHRYHLDVAKRDANREIMLYRGLMPQATSFALASGLIGSFSSIGGKLIQEEQLSKLQDLLNCLDEDDREVLAIRHFENSRIPKRLLCLMSVSQQPACATCVRCDVLRSN